MTTKTEALKLALEALKPVSTYGRVGSRDTDTAKAQQAIAAIREALAEKSSGTEQPTEFLSSFQTEKLAIERGIEWTPAIHDLCNRAIEEEKLAEQPALPFGIGGGLVVIKTLLSRDPCAHAKVAIEMIDAMLAEHMEDNLTMVEQPCTYPNCPYPCPSLPDCRDAEQPAQQQEPVASLLVGQDSDGRYVSITAKAHADTLPPGEYKLYTSQTTIPQGWRLVPVEPTMNMIFAMRRTDTYGDAWTEALNAAPQPQGEQK